tara:strand:+ start:3594 stop:3875 length:282 start_codon:yes stop_codon:yes gene_type:complete
MKNVEDFLEEAINNIRDDRAIASDLLIDIMKHLKTSDEKHIRGGPVAAKYLETLQRSNEQLVKITSMAYKKQVSTKLTEVDKEEIYDLIKGEE